MKSADSIVLIVDDDSSVREAVSSLVRSVGLQTETFQSAQSFLRYQRPDAPACLVLDVRLQGVSGLDLQRELVARRQRLPIIFITGHADVPMTVRAMKAGAEEFLLKPLRDQDLLDAVWRALDRDQLTRQRRAEVTQIKGNYDTLTSREREVLLLIVEGKPNKQVAAELGVAEITIKVHRGHIRQKMNARSMLELVRMFERLVLVGLIEGRAYS